MKFERCSNAVCVCVISIFRNQNGRLVSYGAHARNPSLLFFSPFFLFLSVCSFTLGFSFLMTRHSTLDSRERERERSVQCRSIAPAMRTDTHTHKISNKRVTLKVTSKILASCTVQQQRSNRRKAGNMTAAATTTTRH